MSIVLAHVFTRTHDGLYDPKEDISLAGQCPALRLPGVLGFRVVRNTAKDMFAGEVEVESWAAMEAWEDWCQSPEADEWREKFGKTGQFNERITFEVHK